MTTHYEYHKSNEWRVSFVHLSIPILLLLVARGIILIGAWLAPICAAAYQ